MKNLINCVISFSSSDNIHTAVRRDGNVLLAVDTAGRVLELAQLLVRNFTSVFHNFFPLKMHSVINYYLSIALTLKVVFNGSSKGNSSVY